MQLHASCAARHGAGVLLIGPSGAGKSDLLLRLLDHGFELVADDQVLFEAGRATAPDKLAGLLEIRGLGIVRLEHVGSVEVALVVAIGTPERMPEPATHLGVPLVYIDATQASAPARVVAALNCAMGKTLSVAGAFA